MTAADDIAEMYMHSVTVDTWTGADSWGESTYAATSQPVRCLIVDKVQLVRNAQGQEVVSSSAVYTSLANFAKFAPESVVHLPTRDAIVIAAAYNDGAALDLPSNVVVALT